MNDRDDRLLALLHETVPATSEAGDWEDVVRRAKGRRMARVASWVVPALAIAAVVAVLLVLLVRAGDAGEIGPASTSPVTGPPNPATVPLPKSAYTVLVLNGSGIGRAATRETANLLHRGWSTALPANAPTSNEAVSFMVALPGKEDVADRVARDLGITVTRSLSDYPYPLPNELRDVDAVAVIAKDLAAGP